MTYFQKQPKWLLYHRFSQSLYYEDSIFTLWPKYTEWERKILTNFYWPQELSQGVKNMESDKPGFRPSSANLET